MASVCRFLLISLCILLARAEVTRLRDFTPGEEFKRCLKAFDWTRKSAEDEVAIIDRDPETGCCAAGWTPGTQPLVRREQTLQGIFPILYMYGAVSCGWRNGTYGVVGQKPVSLGGKCDYGTCYTILQNFTCGDGSTPFLNGCCAGHNYGTHCRRGYYFEDQFNVKEDDLYLHLTCQAGSGPGWGADRPCLRNHLIEACYTRSTQDWTLPGEYAGTLTPDDDIIGGILQPWNIYGARWCPTTTTTTTPGINDTMLTGIEIMYEYEEVSVAETEDLANRTNASNFTDTIFEISTGGTTTNTSTTTSTTRIFNTTTTTTTSTTTATSTLSNTTTSTGTTSSSTNSTTTSGAAGYVVGKISIAVDDPVAFVQSVRAQESIRELIAYLAGTSVSPEMIDVTLTAVTSNLFAHGGRRLLGLVDVDFSIILPLMLLRITVRNVAGASLSDASDYLDASIAKKGRLDLTGSIFVQSFAASERLRTTTTTSVLFMGCPESQPCFSQSCGECAYWKEQGLECQKIKDLIDDCICSCFVRMGNLTTPGPAIGRVNAATGSRLAYLVQLMALAAIYRISLPPARA